MKLCDIRIRDPFILAHGGIYYMYGSHGTNDFYVYTSRDLDEWSDAKKVFAPKADFWAERDFWAPEVHEYNGGFYMFASFKAENKCRATQILYSKKPDGDFIVWSPSPVTPPDWECLDGTLYIDKAGKPHMVFCHEWQQIGDGEVCEVMLSDDLKKAVSEPRTLFKASDYKDVVDVRDDRISKVTDGPFMHRTKNGELICVWSSFNKENYAELISRSDNGEIDGNWSVDTKPLAGKDGGHGMFFEDFDKKLKFVLHRPNVYPDERAHIFDVCDTGYSVKLI